MGKKVIGSHVASPPDNNQRHEKYLASCWVFIPSSIGKHVTGGVHCPSCRYLPIQALRRGNNGLNSLNEPRKHWDQVRTMKRAFPTTE